MADKISIAVRVTAVAISKFLDDFKLLLLFFCFFIDST